MVRHFGTDGYIAIAIYHQTYCSNGGLVQVNYITIHSYTGIAVVSYLAIASEHSILAIVLFLAIDSYKLSG